MGVLSAGVVGGGMWILTVLVLVVVCVCARAYVRACVCVCRVRVGKEAAERARVGFVLGWGESS